MSWWRTVFCCAFSSAWGRGSPAPDPHGLPWRTSNVSSRSPTLSFPPLARHKSHKSTFTHPHVTSVVSLLLLLLADARTPLPSLGRPLLEEGGDVDSSSSLEEESKSSSRLEMSSADEDEEERLSSLFEVDAPFFCSLLVFFRVRRRRLLFPSPESLPSLASLSSPSSSETSPPFASPSPFSPFFRLLLLPCEIFFLFLFALLLFFLF
mmetsp:Transcript_15828/g.29245  ORF Transcript_15828/g.29245 Transcript_15828/m.29245 type:complete len:208 (-) Transcript_15828:58-681(-)